MLQIKDLTITHLKDLRLIIKDFSFVLNEGDKAAIIGEEGNGKSTLLKLIYDESLVEGYVEYEGEVLKQNLRFGYLSQEMDKKEKEMKVLEFFGQVPVFYDLTSKDLMDIGRNLGVNLDFFYSDQRISDLSGGEKVKLQIAKILMEQADVLLLDEPTNDIDIETLEWLEGFINSSNQPILYVSHDEMLLENTANVIIHLEQVKRKTEPRYTILKIGYKDYIQKREAGLIRQEQVAKNERNEFAKQQKRLREISQKVDHLQAIHTRQDPHGGRLLKKKMHSIKSMERRFEKEFENFTEIPGTEDAIFIKFGEKVILPNGKKVLELDMPELVIGDKVLARNLVLNIRGSEKVCIIGKNGAGKTTLIKAIAETLLPREDLKVAYMPQNYEELLDYNLTPVEFLTKDGSKEENVRICTYLGSMKYTADEMEHSISELSGGQKAKLLFLKMSMEGCNVLILDEPTRNFSPLSNPVIRKILKEFTGAIISISHDRKYISEVCQKVYRLGEKGLEVKEKD